MTMEQIRKCYRNNLLQKAYIAIANNEDYNCLDYEMVKNELLRDLRQLELKPTKNIKMSEIEYISTELIKRLDELAVNDLLRLKVMFYLYKSLEDEKTLDENCKILDKEKRL